MPLRKGKLNKISHYITCHEYIYSFIHSLFPFTFLRSLTDTNCSESSNVSPSKKLCPSNLFESSPAKDVPNHLETKEARKNMKR